MVDIVLNHYISTMIRPVRIGEFRDRLYIGDVLEDPDIVEEVLIDRETSEEVWIYHRNFIKGVYTGYLFSGVLVKDLGKTLEKAVPDLMYMNPGMQQESIERMQEYLYRIFRHLGGKLSNTRFNRLVKEQVMLARLFGEAAIRPNVEKPIFILYAKVSGISSEQKRMMTFASSRVEMNKRVGSVLELAVHTSIDLEHPLRRIDHTVIKRNIDATSVEGKEVESFSAYAVKTYMSPVGESILKEVNPSRPLKSDRDIQKFEMFMSIEGGTYASLAKAVGISKSKISKFKMFKDGLLDKAEG